MRYNDISVMKMGEVKVVGKYGEVEVGYKVERAVHFLRERVIGTVHAYVTLKSGEREKELIVGSKNVERTYREFDDFLDKYDKAVEEMENLAISIACKIGVALEYRLSKVDILL